MTVRGVSNNPASPLYNANAPALSGSAGALLTVLDAVLVNGFTGFTALGWTIAYTGTNKRQYAMASGGTGYQLYVDDSGPGAGGAREARINGFKTGTALGAGTGQLPTTTLMTAPSGAVVVRKSNTADSTTRYWTVIGDGHTFYVFAETGDPAANSFAQFYSYPWMFGDFFSFSPTDTDNCAIIARTKENSAFFMSNTSGNDWDTNTNLIDGFSPICGVRSDSLSYTIPGNFVGANFTGVGGALQFGKHTDTQKMGAPTNATALMMGLHMYRSSYWTSNCPYPSPPDSGLIMAPVFVHHGGFPRGYLKGLWAPIQHQPLGHGDTYAGTGNLAGKSMIVMAIPGTNDMNSLSSSASGQYAAQVHVEYSDTWQ